MIWNPTADDWAQATRRVGLLTEINRADPVDTKVELLTFTGLAVSIAARLDIDFEQLVSVIRHAYSVHAGLNDKPDQATDEA